MKKNTKKELSLDDFNLIERLSNGMKRTYSLYKDVNLIGVTKTVVTIGVPSVNFLKCKKDDRCILLEKQGVWYLAILPFDSKIKGYKLNHPSSGGGILIFNCNANERGLSIGYYNLIEPIYVNGLDLFELEQFDINN